MMFTIVSCFHHPLFTQSFIHKRTSKNPEQYKEDYERKNNTLIRDVNTAQSACNLNLTMKSLCKYTKRVKYYISK